MMLQSGVDWADSADTANKCNSNLNVYGDDVDASDDGEDDDGEDDDCGGNNNDVDDDCAGRRCG